MERGRQRDELAVHGDQQLRARALRAPGRRRHRRIQLPGQHVQHACGGASVAAGRGGGGDGWRAGRLAGGRLGLAIRSMRQAQPRQARGGCRARGRGGSSGAAPAASLAPLTPLLPDQRRLGVCCCLLQRGVPVPGNGQRASHRRRRQAHVGARGGAAHAAGARRVGGAARVVSRQQCRQQAAEGLAHAHARVELAAWGGVEEWQLGSRRRLASAVQGNIRQCC